MTLRQTVLLVALLNLAYFGVEFGVAIAIGSVSLFADSVDFLEDSLTGAGALAVNLICALMLARFRSHAGSLTRAAFLSARNDAYANVAIVLAGFLTLVTLSAWPDLVVGLGIAVLNADAARDVLAAARKERAEAAP